MKLGNTISSNWENWRKPIFFSIFCIAFLSLFSFSLHAQGTKNQEFWFVAPDANHMHSDRPVFLMISTGDKSAKVTISMPNNPEFAATFPDSVTTRNMLANSSWKFDFNAEQMDIVENRDTTSGVVTNKGIHISADAPIFAYYQIDGIVQHPNRGAQKEIYTLKGEKALGTEFYAPFQTRYPYYTGYGTVYGQIHIVAAEDGTVVTFKAPVDVANDDDGTTYAKDTYHTIPQVLNRGETLLLREKVSDSGLMGTHITTNGRPIAVTVFEGSIHSGSALDPVGDQIVPVNNVGTSYIVVKGYTDNQTSDHVYILATEDNTEVKRGGIVVGTIEKKGGHLRFDIGKGNAVPEAYYYETNKPAYCYHQSAVGDQIGASLIPSMYAIASRRIAFYNQAPPEGPNAIFLIYRESAKDAFRIKHEGQAEKELSVNNSPIGVDGWLYSKQNLEKVEGTTTIQNTEGVFALGYFSGSRTETALYGYLSNFGDFSFGADTIYHCGDNYNLAGGYARAYKWTDPDGDTSENPVLNATKSGSYELVMDTDPDIIHAKVYLKLQNFDNAIFNAPNRLIVDKPYNFSIELDKSDSNNIFKTRYEWDFNEGASVSTSDKAAVQVYYTTPGDKQITLTVTNLDANCDTTITHTIKVVEAPEVMYWSRDAEDRNWNNENNWEDANGDPLLVVPSTDTRVYIPSKAKKYPSLSEDVTDRRFYGEPDVNEIVFRYGSELYHQYKLKYNKAYVNYNWGHYNDSFTEEQPGHSWEDGTKLARDTWHMLAAPLKKMASGDFSLAGRPFSWQQRFQVVTNPQPDGAVTVGDFSLPFPTNDIKLAGNNNAIAVKIAIYKDVTGYHQNYLEGLKGVIEIPYFENKSVASIYPAHHYDALLRKSYFYYFDTRTLRIINSPVGSMDRAAEAYRFVYETEQNEVPDEMYEMRLNTQGMGSTSEIMVGNPFLAPIDAEAFANVNSDNIDSNKGYKLLREDRTWEHRQFQDGNQIPAWKAFIVTLQPEKNGLLFPLDIIKEPNDQESFMIQGAFSSSHTLSTTGPVGDVLSVQVLKGSAPSGDPAFLKHNRHTDNGDIAKMILPDGHMTPEVFFISSDGKSSNLIQQYRTGEKEVAIGVKTSDVNSRFSLEFGNIAGFSGSTGASVILVDKLENVSQDLSRNPVYSFTQQASRLDNQYVDRHRFILQLGSNTGQETEKDTIEGVNIVYRSGVLQVTSDENINTVSVYDLHGRSVFSSPSVNLPRYSYPLPLQSKMYLVRVKTVSGKETVRRIMGN